MVMLFLILTKINYFLFKRNYLIIKLGKDKPRGKSRMCQKRLSV